MFLSATGLSNDGQTSDEPDGWKRPDMMMMMMMYLDEDGAQQPAVHKVANWALELALIALHHERHPRQRHILSHYHLLAPICALPG
jgi:hypothetical protein